jgi:hypothetical protein
MEIPYSSNDPLHCSLCNLNERIDFEQQKALEFGSSDLIIDIPEPISFEVNLPVIESGRKISYINADSVFSGPVIDGFTSSLRKIRVYVPEKDVSIFDKHNRRNL